MITDQRAEEAFEYLRDHVAEIGKAKAELKRAEILSKRIRKRCFVEAPDGSVAQREAWAEIHKDVAEIDERYVKAVEEFEIMSARREVETIAIEVWRTSSANLRRMGT